MAVRHNGTDTGVKAGVGFAALALLLFGWVAMQSLAQGASPPPLPNSGQSSRLLVLGAVLVIGTVSVLLWLLIHNKRARDRAECRLHEIASRLPGAVYVFRQSVAGVGTCEFRSDHAAAQLGITQEQLTQDVESILRLVLEEDRDPLNAALARSRAGLSRFDADLRVRRPDGEVRWIHTVADPIREANGDLVWTGCWSDITESKALEQTLREATRRLANAQSLAQLGDWSCDLATMTMEWSPQVFEMLQRDPALGPLTLAETLALSGIDAAATTDALIHAQELREPRSFDASVTRADGSNIAFQVIVEPGLADPGKVLCLRGTIQDVTARNAIERRLVQERDAANAASRAKSLFLATTSHEIRTPLGSMLGLLELVSLAPVDPETHASIEAARDSGRSLQRIVDDLLDVSQIEAGKVQMRLEAACVADVVEDVYRTYVDSAKRAGLEMRRQVDPTIGPALMLDALRLSQILGNFISNAIKFTRQGSVELRAQLVDHAGDHERLRFEVQDTGIGVSLEDQHNLFQPFEQAGGSAHTFGGSGLGLSIARRLAESMGGKVSMLSEVGSGTILVLEVTVPVADPALAKSKRDDCAAPAPVTASAPATTGFVGNDTLVLVVDDHPVNRMVMRRQIAALGYAAEDVESGAEALERWRTGKFSLVLTDCNMPGMSGYQLSRKIREAEQELGAGRIPIIACSANAIPGVVQDCMDAGMDDYLAKPTQLITISEMLEKWLPIAETHTELDTPSPLSMPAAGAAVMPASQNGRQQTVALGEIRLTKRMLGQFREVNEQDVSSLLEGLERGDMAAVTRAAHRIKGACGFIGATGLASVCAMIEQSGREEDGAAVTWLMDAFHRELEQLNADLDRR